MRRTPLSLALLLIACGAPDEQPTGPGPVAPAAQADTVDTAARRFHVRDVTHLEEVPQGASLRLWIPVPGDDAHQRITGLAVEAPWPWRLTRETTHGNHMLYLEVDGVEAALAAAGVTIAYDVERRAREEDLVALAAVDEGDADEAGAMAPFLRETRLVRLDERLRRIAHEVSQGRPTTLARARAFYDHVRAEMVYDKTGEGWGRGDSLFACAAGRGNCTDFHAYFMALCLARGIPTRFEVGLFGPYERRPGEEVEVGGYHCWAEFRAPGRTWVPVDVSEADKDPSRAEALFGGLTDNRVTLSAGRDLVLEPPQAGEPINFFVAPHAEVDGRPLDGVRRTTTWRDAGAR